MVGQRGGRPVPPIFTTCVLCMRAIAHLTSCQLTSRRLDCRASPRESTRPTFDPRHLWESAMRGPKSKKSEQKFPQQKKKQPARLPHLRNDAALAGAPRPPIPGRRARPSSALRAGADDERETDRQTHERSGGERGIGADARNRQNERLCTDGQEGVVRQKIRRNNRPIDTTTLHNSSGRDIKKTVLLNQTACRHGLYSSIHQCRTHLSPKLRMNSEVELLSRSIPSW